MLSAKSFFSLDDFPQAEVFSEDGFVWDGLNNLKSFMDSYEYPRLLSTYLNLQGRPVEETLIFWRGEILCSCNTEITLGDTNKGGLEVKRNGKLLDGASVIMAGAILIGSHIALGEGVLIEGGATIKSPTIIGDCTEVRQGAYMRGYTLIGKRCVVGHTTEVKHSIFLNDAKAGHFNYLGDSILGNNANLGAGTKFANLRFLSGNVKIKTNDAIIDTGRKKFGAILGDNAQTGCNSVTNPGTLLGPKSMLLPNITAPSGFHPAQSVIKQ